MTGRPADGRFPDLVPRVASGLGLLVVGVAGLWAGGWVLAGLLAVAGGLIAWEVLRMLPQPPGPVLQLWLPLGLGLALLAVGPLGVWGAPLLLWGPVALVAWARLVWREEGGGLGHAVAAWLALALLGLHAFGLLREALGLVGMLWLVGVVIASDVAGYFAGRLLGGPKFWPRVSPKKTWSGTVAGWIAAAGVGLAFAGPMGAGGVGLAALSVVVAIAGQGGDIAESALKRRAGVKDSSALIPGHGGLADRFDAMLAAALVAWLALLAGAMP